MSVDFSQYHSVVTQLSQLLIAQKLMLCTAESCTGGLIAAVCTNTAGSSAWFSHAIVSYSNQAKQNLLGVSEQLIAKYGAVSERITKEMLTFTLESPNLVGISVSGIAGPSGGSATKPVGTVCFGFALRGKISTVTYHFTGNRQQIREMAVMYGLQQLINQIKV